jgi:hypothetical protein
LLVASKGLPMSAPPGAILRQLRPVGEQHAACEVVLERQIPGALLIRASTS